MIWRRQAIDLLFPADSDRWLSVLRLGLGIELVFYTWPLRADWNYIFGGSGAGLLSRQLSEALLSTESPFIPRLGWLVSFCRALGGSERFALSLAWYLLLGAGCFLLLGLFSRTTAVVAWLVQLSAAKSCALLSYGADDFTTIGLFYLMISPLPDRWSLDSWIHPTGAADPQIYGFHRRVLQIHLCFIYFFGGITKCLGAGWWDGSNMWRALTLPTFDVLPMGLVASWRPILPALGISVCLIETSYALLIWPRWSRRAVLYGVCAMHISIGLMMGMYVFALIMLVLNLAAFGPPSGPVSNMERDSIAPVKI